MTDRTKEQYACGECGKPIKTGCYCSDACANADNETPAPPTSNPVTDLFLAELIDRYDAAPGAHWCGRAVVDCLRELQKRRAVETTTRRPPHWTCKTHGNFDAMRAVGCPECMRLARDALKNVRDHGCNECLECAVAIIRLLGSPEEPSEQRICLGCGQPYPCPSDCPAGSAVKASEPQLRKTRYCDYGMCPHVFDPAHSNNDH